MTDTGHHKASGAASGLTTYSVRRMRNTAVLVKWIEDHQSNPYPTKAEKQYLAYYSGMNLTQLSTWFANARRRIKKIGMKTWLEGRSTFSLDTSYFPSSSSLQARADTYSGSSYPGLTATSPYAAAAYSPLATGLHSSYPSYQHSPLTMGSGSNHVTNGLSSYDGSLQPTSSTTSPMGGIYGTSTNARSSVMGLGMSTLPMANWPSTPILSSTPVSFPSLQSRPSSGNAAPLHSPLTAQVYTADGSAGLQLRTHSSQNLDVSDTSYSLQHQHSPDQMLPECASSEPILTDHSHKSAATIQN